MARREIEQPVKLSLIDRLIDFDPDSRSDSTMVRANSVRLLKSSLRRDLEWLLNTRRIPDAPDRSFLELSRSVYNFGLPDATALNHQVVADRERLLRMLETTVATFEPRLSRVRITPVENPGKVHVLRFQIEGLLSMDPEPERICFDTVLQLSGGGFSVKGELGAG